MGYWGRVAKRAAKEAAGDVRLGVVPVAVSFAGQAVLGLIFFVVLGAGGVGLPMRVASAFLPLLLFPIFFVYRLVTVPAAMARETRGPLSLGRPQLAVRRDVGVHEAACWIVFREWGRSLEADGDGRVAEIVNALCAIRQAALDGHVIIWGKVNRWGPHHKIAPEFWAAHRMEEMSLFRANEEGVHTVGDSVRVENRYADLMTSRAQMETEWPRL